MPTPGAEKKMTGNTTGGFSSSVNRKKKEIEKKNAASGGRGGGGAADGDDLSKSGFKAGTIAHKREVYRRYSFRSDMAKGKSDESETRTGMGLTKSSLEEASSKLNSKAGDRGEAAHYAATFKAKQAGLTAAQQKEQRSAMFGLFITQTKLMQFSSDYGLLHHLVSRDRVKELSQQLNRTKNVTLGMKTTGLNTKNLQSEVLNKAGQTTAQKLKSKRMSVLQSLDAEYLHEDTHAPLVYGTGANRSPALFDNEKFDRNFKTSAKTAVNSKQRASDRKPIVTSKDCRVNLNGGLSFSEFMEYLCVVATEGMTTPHYHNMFNTPFKKIQALLTIWGVADIKKLEEVLQMHVDIVL